MKAIDSLLTAADKALNDHKLVKDNSIGGTKVRAIAGFGAMVINIGLLPSLAVYKDKHKDVLAALEQISGESFAQLIKEKSQLSLSRKRALTEKFVNASVALKIMARTYLILKDKYGEAAEEITG